MAHWTWRDITADKISLAPYEGFGLTGWRVLNEKGETIEVFGDDFYWNPKEGWEYEPDVVLRNRIPRKDR